MANRVPCDTSTPVAQVQNFPYLVLSYMEYSVLRTPLGIWFLTALFVTKMSNVDSNDKHDISKRLLAPDLIYGPLVFPLPFVESHQTTATVFAQRGLKHPMMTPASNKTSIISTLLASTTSRLIARGVSPSLTSQMSLPCVILCRGDIALWSTVLRFAAQLTRLETPFIRLKV